MVDPIDGLNALQAAIDANTIHMKVGKFHPDIKCLIDYPEGETRYTYAKIVDREVQGIAVLGLVHTAHAIPYFQIGFGVVKSRRGLGIGIRLMKKALKEFVNETENNSMKEFYLQAIVSVGNEASNKIARKFISNSPKSIEDRLCGEPGYQYLCKVKC